MVCLVLVCLIWASLDCKKFNDRMAITCRWRHPCYPFLNQVDPMTDLAATGQSSASSDNASFYSINGWWVFAGMCFIYLFFNWYLQTQVLTDQVYYYSLGGRISTEKLAAFLDAQHHVSFLSYVLVPATLVIRMALVSFCILTGLLLTSNKLSFKAI